MNDAIPGLSKKQLAARKKGIGGSDARKIMAGNWLDLWNEKTGRVPPEDLSGNLAVQMGNWTEEFNAIWFEQRTGIKVNRSLKIKETTHVHPVHSFMICHLDGEVVIDGRKRAWEAKHTNPFGSTDDVKELNYPQFQHNIEVGGYEGIEVSVFYGNLKWVRFSIERDPDYIAELMDRESAFWRFVETDTPPPAEGEAIKRFDPNAPRIVNMQHNNMWCDSEATWIQFRESVLSFNAAEATLKGMVEGDVGFAFGNELVCVKDRAGKLSLRTPNTKDNERINAALEAEADALAKEDANA